MQNLERLENFCVVLVLPKHPGNVGAVARTMGNTGFSDLRIVDNRDEGGQNLHCHPDAIARACSAADILEKSNTFPDLESALADSTFAVGSSARRREKIIPKTPRETAPTLSLHAQQGKVALVFGREDEGLNVEELSHCHALIRIPTAPKHSSLNLSHAVQVIAYEVMLAVLQPGNPERPVPAEQKSRDRFFAHAKRTLCNIGAFAPDLADRKLRYLRNILDRSQPTEDEVRFLHGMFRQMNWVLSSWLSGKAPPPGWVEKNQPHSTNEQSETK